MCDVVLVGKVCPGGPLGAFRALIGGCGSGGVKFRGFSCFFRPTLLREIAEASRSGGDVCRCGEELISEKTSHVRFCTSQELPTNYLFSRLRFKQRLTSRDDCKCFGLIYLRFKETRGKVER